MQYLDVNCGCYEILMASDQVLIESYINAPFDYDEITYDLIAEEMAYRGILEDNQKEK